MQTTSKSLPTLQGPSAQIPLKYPLYATIDLDDWDAIHKFHWSLRKSHSCYYAVRKETVRGLRRTVFMHRQIARASETQEVHHKNKNTLDNRKSNLQLTTPRDHHLAHAQLSPLMKFD